ncbi:MAG: 50S ribosomal protein L11 methyltransferase [Anaerolineales bacterium]|nr:50S ribosomal protein L11 methyltransferase [Anaerolineales bacterium]
MTDGPMNWLEVSLTVNAEAAEAVSEVLARFAPAGVAVEATNFTVTPDDHGVPVGDVIVRAYLPADAELEQTRARLEESLWHLGQLLPLPAPVYTPIADQDWSEAWKANFKPFRVGKRLMVIPAWLDPPLAPDDVPIRLDPGMAFGTGTHPTTQLCLCAVERHLKPGQTVIDVGTGSGILAIAAAKLGADRVLACDIDAEAVWVAQENVAANGVADRVRVTKGSLAELRAEGASAPLVLVNILASVIVRLFEEGLADLVEPGGRIVLSGILEAQAYEVRAALQRHGLTLAAQEHLEDWVALIAEKEGKLVKAGRG